MITPAATKYILRKVPREHREDLLQDVELTLWRERHKFDASRGKLSGWVMFLTKRTVTDWIDSRRCRIQCDSDEGFVSVTRDAHAAAEARLTLKMLGYDELPYWKRAALEARYSGQEVSASTRAIASRALADLRNAVV